ncbi:MAG: glycosyltransferase, partial [Terracidiphilus sp.]
MSDAIPSLAMLPPGDPSDGPAAWVRAIKHSIGIDRAILFTVAARILQGLGSVVTVLLIVRLLTPAEQGYYYAFWSLVALQIVFELGFSFVVLQVAAHERAHLQLLPDGAIKGDERAHSRLASILQWSVRWYLIMAALMGIAMLAGATRFFSLRQPGSEAIWLWPLRGTVLACCVTFAIGPVISFLEGSGMVMEVARMRFTQSLVSSGLAWTAMLIHHGLIAPAMVLTGQGMAAFVLILNKRSYLVPLMRKRVRGSAIRWRREVWPFQWRIAVSWMCEYFIFQLFTPVLFAFRGPVEAGRMGLSMSAVTQLGGIVLAWMSTKAAPFGTLAARQETEQLDRLFFRTLRQSLALFACGALALLSIVIALPHTFPRIGERIAAWPIFLLLLLTAASSHIVQSEALYLRAHQVEPFLLQSIVIASATAGLVLVTSRPYGTLGVSLSYFIVLGVAGLISASMIFTHMRRRWAVLGGKHCRPADCGLPQGNATRSLTSAPQVSVVMCTYNGERFLGQQLESIAAQSVLPFELVVCDDQSNDGTIALLEAFSKTAPFAVRIYQNPARLKSTHNFQQGIALARGQLIALCDQDDLWKPEKLERLVGLMQDASLAGIFTDAELIDNEGRVLDGSLWDRGHFPLKEEAEFQRDPIGVLLKQDVATGATMIFRSAVRDLYHEIPQQWVHDGWLTWMMVLHSDELGRVAPSRERWMSYRVHQGQQTGEEAARVGSRSEPLAQRMEKARKLGHA